MELRIKQILRERNITQQQLADMLGITRSAITQQLAGKPSLVTLEKIAEALEVEMWELFKSKSEIVEEITEETKNTIRCPKCGARFVLDEKEE